MVDHFLNSFGTITYLLPDQINHGDCDYEKCPPPDRHSRHHPRGNTRHILAPSTRKLPTLRRDYPLLKDHIQLHAAQLPFHLRPNLPPQLHRPSLSLSSSSLHTLNTVDNSNIYHSLPAHPTHRRDFTHTAIPPFQCTLLYAPNRYNTSTAPAPAPTQLLPHQRCSIRLQSP